MQHKNKVKNITFIAIITPIVFYGIKNVVTNNNLIAIFDNNGLNMAIVQFVTILITVVIVCMFYLMKYFIFRNKD
jgi:hypothetical protein